MKTLARAFGVMALAVVAAATPARAYFEQVVTGTRGVSLGASALAAIDDVSALYWNPAALAKLQAATKVQVEAAEIEITGGTKIRIGVGSNSIVIDAGGISIGGSKITSDATGLHEIKGAMVKIN